MTVPRPGSVEPYSEAFAEVYDAVFDDEAARTRNAAIEAHLLKTFADAGREVRDVVDLAAGTGAQTLPLVRRGLKVRAQDASPHMLAHLRRRLEAEGLVCEVVEQPMQATRGEEVFDAALCCFSAFNHLLTLEDQRRTLAAVYRALRPGGVFLFDAAHFFALLGRYQPTRNVLRERDGTLVEQTIQHRFDPFNVLWTHRQLTRVTPPDGAVRVRLDDLRLRMVSRGELELLVQEAGFDSYTVAPGYDGRSDFSLVFTAVK